MVRFLGKRYEGTIDLGKAETISKISINTLSSEGSWIYYPKSIGILVSEDGKNYIPITIVSSKEIYEKKGKIVVEFDKHKVQFVKVIAENNGIIADGKPGAGSNSWLFADEIMVE